MTSEYFEERPKYRDRTVAPPPPAIMLLNPIRHVGWAWDFVARWCFSRPVKRNFLAALPFTLVFVGVIAWRVAPETETRYTYEAAANYGARNENDELSRLSIQRLVSDFPEDAEYRRLLAEQLLRDGDLVVATRQLRRLASPNGPANSKQRALANLSLAKLSADKSNRFSLQPTDFEERLQFVLEILPDRDEAHQLLSEHYLNQNQYAKAEPHIARISGKNPQRLFGLSQIQIRIGKQEEAQKVAEQADRLLTARIEAGNATTEDYVLRASVLNSLGQSDKAETMLLDGLKRDRNQFRIPLARHYTALARKKLSLSPFYRRQAAELLQKAFSIAPESPIVAAALTQLARDKQALSNGLAGRLQDHWDQRSLPEEATPQTLASAAQFSRINGDMDKAVLLLERAAELDENYADSLVGILFAAERTQQALDLFSRLSKGYEAQLASNPKDAAARVRLARILQGVGRTTEAETLLRDAPRETEQVRLELVSVLREQCSEAIEHGEAPDHAKLTDALRRAPYDAFLLQLMAKQSVGDDAEVTSQSRDFILQLVAEGDVRAGLAYGALGTAALDAKKYESAERDLIQSVTLERLNPLAFNNLAVTLSRKKSPDLKRALAAAEEALRLLPDHETLLATKGEILLELERWAEAAQILQQAVGRGKRTVEIHQQLARAYRKLGNEELAAQHERLAAEVAKEE